MKVQDVMTSPAHSTSPEVSLTAAARTMSDYSCGALPVLDVSGRPIGILTARDICRALAVGNRYGGLMRVREAMTPHAITCSPATPLAEALETLAKSGIRRMPVVDAQGRLVGIVSLSDIVAGVDDSQWIASPLLRRLVAASRNSTAFRPWRTAFDQAPN